MELYLLNVYAAIHSSSPTKERDCTHRRSQSVPAHVIRKIILLTLVEKEHTNGLNTSYIYIVFIRDYNNMACLFQ
jgi:hypothetical protein